MAVRAGEHGDAAGGVHAHLAAFKQTGPRAQSAGYVAGRQAAGLDVAGVANAAQQAFGLASAAPCGKAGHVAQLVGVLQAGMEVARVVLQRHRGLVRELSDEVATANFVLAQAQLKRGAAHNALEQVSGFRSSSASVGIHRRGVGEPGVHLHIHLRRAVLAGQQGGVQDGGHSGREGRQVSAQVGVGVDFERQELAVFVDRQRGVAGMVAAMGVAQEGFRAVAVPLDVAVQLFRGPGQAHVFGIQVNLGAKAAAHVGCNHTHFVFRQAHHKGREQQALDVRILVRHV